MSADDIKVVAQVSPVPSIKIGGKCYSLASANIRGPGGKTFDELNVENTYADCATCNASGNVPNVCPGDLSASYQINVSTPTPSCPYVTAYTGTDWDGVCSLSGSCTWSVAGSGSASVQIPTTSLLYFYGLGGISAGVGNNAEIGLVASTYWYAYVRTGQCFGAWVKRDGATPVGVYELLIGSATFVPGGTATWTRPTSMTVSEVA